MPSNEAVAIKVGITGGWYGNGRWDQCNLREYLEQVALHWQRGYNNAAYDCGKGQPGERRALEYSTPYQHGYSKGLRDYG